MKSTRLFVHFFLLCCFGLMLGTAQAQSNSGKRVALVIGNDAYQQVSKLQKAGNDATAMARELKGAGFEVLLHRDLNYRGMVRAVEAFTGKISSGDQVVVFFAGHGVQIKSGSYLLPVDIEAASESEVEKTAYSLTDLTEKIGESKAGFSLVLVDACRDNPLKSYGRSVGTSRGLSAIEPPKGQMVVYSASRGQQALDRLNERDSNPNGVFTREFIARMKRPGVRIEDMVREVQEAVEALAKSVNHEQRPAIYNEARGNFYFFGPTSVQAAPAADNRRARTPEEIEDAYWDGIKNSRDGAAFNAYLSEYPKGRYANLARNALRSLGPQAAKPQGQSGAVESSAWKKAEQAGTAEAYASYLAQFPNGQYKALAQLRIARFNAAQDGPMDDAKSRQARLAAAESGDSAAMVALGENATNEAEAKEWYRKAAVKGNLLGAFRFRGLNKGRSAVDVAAIESVLVLPAGAERVVNINGEEAVNSFVASDPFFQMSQGQEKLVYSYPDASFHTTVSKTCEREGNLFATTLELAWTKAEQRSLLGGLVALESRATSSSYLGTATTKITSVEKIHGQAFPLKPGSRFGMSYTTTTRDARGTIFGLGANVWSAKWYISCSLVESKGQAAGTTQGADGAQQVACWTNVVAPTPMMFQPVRLLRWHEASGCLADTQ